MKTLLISLMLLSSAYAWTDTFETGTAKTSYSGSVDTTSTSSGSALVWGLSDNVLYHGSGDTCRGTTVKCIRAKFASTPGTITLKTAQSNVGTIGLWVATYPTDTTATFSLQRSTDLAFTSPISIRTNEIVTSTVMAYFSYTVNQVSTNYYRIIMVNANTQRLNFDDLTITPIPSSLVETFTTPTGTVTSKGSYAGVATINFSTGPWTIGENVIYNTVTGSDKCDGGSTRCMRMKVYSTLGYSRLTMAFDWTNVNSLTYKIGSYGSDVSPQTINVHKSTNGGVTWSGSIGTWTYTSGGPYTVTYNNLAIVGSVRFEWRCSSSTTTNRLNIDSVTYTVGSILCGNGVINSGETCDDGNTINGDGCTNGCAVETSYTCSGAPSVCSPIVSCGNGLVDGTEKCDDGNTTNGDGCSSTCNIESSYTCTGSPSICTLTVPSGSTCDISSCLTNAQLSSNYRGEVFRSCLRSACYVNKARILGYSGNGPLKDYEDTITGPTTGYVGNARMHIYNYIWNSQTGTNANKLICPYGGYTLDWTYGQTVLPDTATQFINLEHILPQSAFRYPTTATAAEPMRSDMHHMAPTHSYPNGARSHYDFGELDDTPTSGGYLDASSWYIDGNVVNSVPSGTSSYSKLYTDPNGNTMSNVWEPKSGSKGLVARAIAYMYTMYPDQLASYASQLNPTASPAIYPGIGKVTDFFSVNDMCGWDLSEPVTTIDAGRDNQIASRSHQRNHNPYVQYSNTRVTIGGVSKTLCQVAFEYI